MKTKVKKMKGITTLIMMLFVSVSYGQENNEDVDKKPEPKKGLALKMNDHWSVKLSGLVNTFYTNTVQAADPNTGAKEVVYNSIQNGINGALLVLNPMYKEGDLTIKGNFMFSMGVNSHGLYGNQNIGGFTFSSFDVRQASATISNPKWGSVTFGRDFGLVGLDAILQDVTFLGVGANWNFSNPSYVTLAGIGYGYVFVDKMAQATYTSPTFLNSTTLSLGVYEPYKALFSNLNDGVDTQKPESLGINAKLNIVKKFNDEVSIHASSSFTSQKVSEYMHEGTLTNNNLTSYGLDAFVNLTIKRFNLTGYYYTSNGAGVDGLQFRPIVELPNGEVELVKGNSYYGQLTYKTGNEKPWLFGVIYGSTTVQDVVSGNSLTEQSSARTSGVLGWQVHPNIALRGEYTVQDKGLFAPAPKYNIIVLGATVYF